MATCQAPPGRGEFWLLVWDILHPFTDATPALEQAEQRFERVCSGPGPRSGPNQKNAVLSLIAGIPLSPLTGC